jgi:hypothetical protein
MASQIPGDQSKAKTKNPYQMRFDLLHLAKDILEQNAHMAREDKAKDRKSFFTTDEVIETAEKLNEFISAN